MKKLLLELNELAEGKGKIYAKVKGKLKKLGVEESVDSIRDFLTKVQTPRCEKLIEEFKKLSYDPSKGWYGNEDFFEGIGISKDEYLNFAKERGDMVYEPGAVVEQLAPLRANVSYEEETKTVVCPLCKSDVPEEDMEDHLEDHDARRKQPIKKMKREENEESCGEYEEELVLRCPTCNKVVPRDEMEDHMGEHDSKQNRPIKKMRPNLEK